MLYYSLISITAMLFFATVISREITEYFNNLNINKALSQAIIWADSISKADYFTDDVKKKQTEANIDSAKNSSLNMNESSDVLLIIDKNGVVAYEYNQPGFSPVRSLVGSTFFIPEVLKALKGSEGTSIDEVSESVYVSAPIKNSQGETLGAVLVVSSISENMLIVSEINKVVLLMTVVSVSMISVLVLVATNTVTGSVKKFSQVVERMSFGDLSQRVEVKGKDEFADLAVAFNKMATDIEQSAKIRSEFVSNVSHELKTPLSSIKILSESILLQEDVPSEMYKEFLSDIVSEVDRMNNIVNDLLEIVRSENKKAVLNTKEEDIGSLIGDIIKRLTPIAEESNVTLSFAEPDKNVVANVDNVKLTLALSNLIENGIKYNKEDGKVDVNLTSDHQHFFVNVKDTGIGISEEDREQIFERFYRVDKTRDRETGGTGLGLSITSTTIMLHNGSIKLTSKEGEGSDFLVRIPLNRVEKAS